jgi:hypothetical protein
LTRESRGATVTVVTGETSRVKTEKMRRVELEQGRDLDALLTDLYHREGLTYAQVGEKIGVPESTVAKWIVDRGLDAATLARRALETA